jgi:hypothetical protein
VTEMNHQFQGLLTLSLNGDLEGYLYKKSPAMLRGWQFRKFILKDRKLKWFKCSKKEAKGKKNKNRASCLEDVSEDDYASGNDTYNS